LRTTILIILTICLFGFGYLVYWVMQGSDNVAPITRNRTPMTRPALTTLPTAGSSAMGAGGERPYWERFDPNTGERTSRLRAERYQPQKDGRVLVTNPEVEFYLKDHRLLRILGQTGLITMEENVSRPSGAMGAGTNRAPRSGNLRDVTLLLFANAQDKEPELTMTMNNASFDNETFRIQTEAFIERGKIVPADQVPVTVRGAKYEFDGKGLIIRYNELDRRLDFLNVAHGRRLLIKDAEQFMHPATQPASAAWSIQRLPLPATPFPGVVLVAADRASAGEAARRDPRKAAPASRPAPEEPVYRAIFSTDVEIIQAGKKLATAKDMIVDFLNESGGELSMLGVGPARALATRPAVAPAPATRQEQRAPNPPTTRNADRPARRQAAATTRPTTNPTQGPIEIFWNGPLTIVPLLGDRPERIAPGESIVRLVGSAERPVDVTHSSEQASSRIKCAHLTFWTIDNGALLEASPTIPVEVTDSRGTHIITRSMLYSQANGTAVLTGNSRATLPLVDETAPEKKPDANAADIKKDPKKPELLNVDWTDSCTLYMHGDAFEAMAIDRADLRGNVTVDHPQLKMTSETLQLAFAPDPAPPDGAKRTSPPLRQIDANGSVRCLIVGPNGPADLRKIDCETLKLLTARTPAGQLYARSIAAIGAVHAIDAERDLQAGYVHVTLAAPTTRPATRPTAKGADLLPGELESLVAHENVIVLTPDGKSAKADQLTLDVKDKQLAATLQGEPAEVKANKNTLTGVIIHMIPDRKQISVTGAGTLDGISQKTATDTPRPIKVTWAKSMRADGNDNLVECFGSVKAESTDPDGTVNIVRGDRVRLITTTRPSTTQPATKPAVKVGDGNAAVASTNPSTRPTSRPSEFDALGDRVVRSIAIQDDASVQSDLTDPTGKQLRAFRVKSASIFYDREARRLTIPQAGWLGFMDNRPPSTQPAAQQAAKDPFGMRGMTVFEWTKSLVYDEAAAKVTLTGDTTLAKPPVTVTRVINPGESTEPFRLVADNVVADIEPTSDATTRPAGDEFSPKMQFRRVHAEGHVRVTGKDINFEAETIDYDPVNHLVTVRGTERRRAVQRDAMDVELASFDELVWNTEKGEIVSSKAFKASPSAPPRAGVLKQPGK